jgi:hypothetical protein
MVSGMLRRQVLVGRRHAQMHMRGGAMRPLGMHSQGLRDNSCALNDGEEATQ